MCAGDHYVEPKTMVFPSTNVTRESSMKKIVLIRPRSTVHPNIVMPPGFACKYITAWPKNMSKHKNYIMNKNPNIKNHKRPNNTKKDKKNFFF